MNSRSSTILTSWPVHTGAGSGVARVASGLGRALKVHGWESTLISPSISGGGYLSTSVKRILFNYRLRTDAAVFAGKPLVAFDFDGFLLPGGVRFAQVNGGVLGDIVRFETGLIRQAVGFMAMLEKRAAQKADRIFTPSVYSKKTLIKLYGLPEEKVEVMHNGIFFKEWCDKVAAAKRTENRPPTCLSVARFYKRKGLDCLLRSWPKVVATCPGARLRIVGDGLERENLHRLAESLQVADSVEWVGELLAEDDLASQYANCDVFCLPSRHESFGLVFLEAMAAQKPVVAVNTTAVPEVVRDGLDGILAPPDSVDGVAEGIISLLKNSRLRKQMGEAGKERVRKNFDFADVVRPLVDWMEKGDA